MNSSSVARCGRWPLLSWPEVQRAASLGQAASPPAPGPLSRSPVLPGPTHGGTCQDIRSRPELPVACTSARLGAPVTCGPGPPPLAVTHPDGAGAARASGCGTQPPASEVALPACNWVTIFSRNLQSKLSNREKQMWIWLREPGSTCPSSLCWRLVLGPRRSIFQLWASELPT